MKSKEPESGTITWGIFTHLSERELAAWDDSAPDRLLVTIPEEPDEAGLPNGYRLWPGRQVAAVVIEFQDGPVREKGRNGISEECLLAILIHRLEAHQNGLHRCFDNQQALNSLREALRCLHLRTDMRIRAGEEDSNRRSGRLGRPAAVVKA